MEECWVEVNRELLAVDSAGKGICLSLHVRCDEQAAFVDR